MAFCKYCGKEYPDGGSCSCPEAQAEAAGNAPAPAPAADGSAPVASKNNSSAGIIAAVVAVIVIILIFVLIGGNMGAKGAAKKFAKKMSTKKGGKTYYSMTLSDDVIKELKDDDKYEDMIDDYNDTMEELLDNYKVKIKKIEKKDKLSKTELKGAEVLFAQENNDYSSDKLDADDFDAKKGYEFKVKIQRKDLDDDEKKSETEYLCVVKFKGEGWKVLLTDADNLKSAGKSADKSSKSNDDDDYDDDYDDFEW